MMFASGVIVPYLASSMYVVDACVSQTTCIEPLLLQSRGAVAVEGGLLFAFLSTPGLQLRKSFSYFAFAV